MGDPVARPIALPATAGASGLFGPDPGSGATGGFVDVSGIAGVETGGSNGVTCIVREGSATGRVLAAIVCTAGGAGVPTSFSHAVRSNGRLYAVVTGTGTLAGSVHVL